MKGLRLRRAWRARREFARWRAQHPEAPFSEFYVAYNGAALDRNGRLGSIGASFARPERQRELAERSLAQLRERGLKPHHVCVDYGCGSLRLGEVLMEALDPGHYIGLDVTRRFIEAGLERLPPDLVAARRPTLAVIDADSLAAARRARPDFVVSINAVQHVPPAELEATFGRLASLMGPTTRCFITLRLARLGWRVRPETWVHGSRHVARVLRRLGFCYRWVDEYENRRRGSTRHVQEIELVRAIPPTNRIANEAVWR